MFLGFVTGAPPSLPSRLSQYERLLEPVAGSAEFHEPTLVHHAVDDGRRKLVVGEDRAPPAELDVGGEYHAPPLVAVRYDLVQEPRLGHVGEQPVERPPPAWPCRGAAPAARPARTSRGSPPRSRRSRGRWPCGSCRAPSGLCSIEHAHWRAFFLCANLGVPMEFVGPWLIFGQQVDLLVKE